MKIAAKKTAHIKVIYTCMNISLRLIPRGEIAGLRKIHTFEILMNTAKLHFKGILSIYIPSNSLSPHNLTANLTD